MIIRGATEEDVYAALEVADYGYHNLCFGEKPKPMTESRLSWRLGLSVEDLDGPPGAGAPLRRSGAFLDDAAYVRHAGTTIQIQEPGSPSRGGRREGAGAAFVKAV